MKKRILILLIFTFFIFSCKNNIEPKKEINVENKELIIKDNSKINYPSINNEVDEQLKETMKLTCDTIESNYHTIPKTTYESFVSKNYISYLITYKFNNNEITKSYVYDVNTKKRVYFNNNLITKINSVLKNKYNINNSDLGFINVVINNDEIVAYLSTYITNSDVEKVKFAYSSTYLGENITSITNKKVVALTFDDGPSSNSKKIVNLLDELNIKATFFVLGCNVEKYADELKYINDHGNEIGNHSYSHPDFRKLSLEQGLKEIEKTQAIVFKTIGRYPRIFRFPYGLVNKQILNNIKLPTILWNADSLDWQCCDTKTIIKRVEKEVKENGILLFHDFKNFNEEAIRIIVNDLKKQGFEFVTISELLEFRNEENMQLGKVIYSK